MENKEIKLRSVDCIALQFKEFFLLLIHSQWLLFMSIVQVQMKKKLQVIRSET